MLLERKGAWRKLLRSEEQGRKIIVETINKESYSTFYGKIIG
jgi:hypothetical protein